MSEAKIYLGNLSYDARERDLEKFLKGYGRIRNLQLKEGYGFAEFEDKRDAEDAVKDLDGTNLDGRRVRVEHTRDSGLATERRGRDDYRGGGGGGASSFGRGRPPGPRTGYRLIVENMSSGTSWQDLKDYMRQAGEVTYTNCHEQRTGEGVAEFASRSDMDYALDKLDGTELGGRRIKLSEEGGGGGRSRSRSR